MLHQSPQTLHACCREIKGMVPVSPTGTTGSFPKMDVMGRTYSTCLLLLRSYIIVESTRASHPGKWNEYAVYVEICKNTCDMHTYATWASSALVFL